MPHGPMARVRKRLERARGPPEVTSKRGAGGPIATWSRWRRSSSACPVIASWLGSPLRRRESLPRFARLMEPTATAAEWPVRVVRCERSASPCPRETSPSSRARRDSWQRTEGPTSIASIATSRRFREAADELRAGA